VPLDVAATTWRTTFFGGGARAAARSGQSREHLRCRAWVAT
jgi:hypothetical protein